MLLILLILPILLPWTVAGQCCQLADQLIVMEQWNSIWNRGDAGILKIIIGRTVFTRLIEQLPETRELFRNVKVDDMTSPEFNAHCVRVFSSLDIMMNFIHDPQALSQHILHLKKQHISRNIKPRYFVVFGNLLIEVLSQVLREYDAQSWDSCFKVSDAVAKDMPKPHYETNEYSVG